MAPSLILRHSLVLGGASSGFAAEDCGQVPESLVAGDPPDLLLGLQPSRGHPAFGHVVIPPEGDIGSPLLDPACGLSIRFVVAKHLCSEICRTGGSCSSGATQTITANGYNVFQKPITWTWAA